MARPQVFLDNQGRMWWDRGCRIGGEVMPKHLCTLPDCPRRLLFFFPEKAKDGSHDPLSWQRAKDGECVDVPEVYERIVRAAVLENSTLHRH